MSAPDRGHTDPLTALLPGPGDADRPWLVWYSPDERVELTGHVLSMWAAKTAGLLASEAPARPVAGVALPVGWRALTWCLGTWLAGGCVVVGAQPGAAVDVSVAGAEADLDAGAEVQVLVPAASLAVRWDGVLPPLVLDGVADVMPHADRFAALPTGPGDPALQRADGSLLDRGVLAEAARAYPTGSGRARLVDAGAGDLAQAVIGVLGAWADGATAVLLAPGCDEALRALATRQERVGDEGGRG